MKTSIYHYPSRREIVSYEPFDYAVEHLFSFCDSQGLVPEKNKNGFEAGGIGHDYRVTVQFEDGRERFINWDKYKSL